MTPVVNFRPRTRGDTTKLTVLLRRQDVQSGEKSSLLYAGDAVEWLISPPGQAALAGNAVVGGAANLITVDAATGQVEFPLSPAQTTGMPVAAVPFKIRHTDSDGVVTTLLRGVIPFED